MCHCPLFRGVKDQFSNYFRAGSEMTFLYHGTFENSKHVISILHYEEIKTVGRIL